MTAKVLGRMAAWGAAERVTRGSSARRWPKNTSTHRAQPKMIARRLPQRGACTARRFASAWSSRSTAGGEDALEHGHEHGAPVGQP